MPTTEMNFAHIYTATVDSITGEYLLTPLSGFYPVIQLRDDQDSAADGVVADDAPLTLYFSVTVPGATLVGVEQETGGPGGVAVTNGSTIWFVSDTDLNAGDRVTLTDAPLNMNCFAKGTLIAGPDGEIKVEDLSIGDPILTADGRTVKTRWVGYQCQYPLLAKERMQPVRIKAGALGHNTPSTDLIVTGDHGMYVDGYLINASALVNGSSIGWLPMEDIGSSMTFYHVETDCHDVIVANGANAESYLDCPTRAGFDNFAEYLELYGAERLIHEMPLARISSSRLVPRSIKAKLGMDDADSHLWKRAS